MSMTDETKPAGKSKRRKGKGERSKKAVAKAGLPETPPAVELQSPEQEQPETVVAESPKVEPRPAAVEEPVVAAAAPPEPGPEPVAASPPSAPVPAAPPVADATSVEPTPAQSPAESAPVSLQTIANAYRDYTRKSIADFGSFVEQLSGARSLDKAMTLQTEFVKRAYETSVAESQKICELHNRLAKQALDPFKGLTGKTPSPHGKP
jgi:phasin family protein